MVEAALGVVFLVLTVSGIGVLLIGTTALTPHRTVVALEDIEAEVVDLIAGTEHPVVAR